MPKKGIVNIIGGFFKPDNSLPSSRHGSIHGPKDGLLRILGGKIGGYLIWILIILLGVSVFRNIVRVRSIRGEVAREQAKIDNIKAENARLENEIAKTQADTFVEKQIRDKLGLAKEGETIVILPEPEVVKKFAPTILEEENTLPDPNWKQWLKLFI